MNQTEALDFLATMGREIVTQDVRMTSDPVYNVCVESSGHRVVKATFLTYEAAKRYQRDVLGHEDYMESYVFVDSGYENAEWKALREACVAIYESAGGDLHKRRFDHMLTGENTGTTFSGVRLHSLPDVAKAWACECDVGATETWKTRNGYVHTITRTA